MQFCANYTKKSSQKEKYFISASIYFVSNNRPQSALLK